MQQRTLAAFLLESRTTLQASQAQMARFMRMDIEGYKALESGAKVLPYARRRNVRDFVNGLLKRCGLDPMK